MANQSFKEILQMIVHASNATFTSGAGDVKRTIVECAAQIYIAQMKGGAE